MAIAYWVAGRLALGLAIQPGYATPIWPGAGIALSAVLGFGPGVWPASSSAPIRVEIHRSNGSAGLSVADDGIGLPPDLDISSTQTLGLQVVCALARQLHGSVAAEIDNGTRFRLSFPVADAA